MGYLSITHLGVFGYFVLYRLRKARGKNKKMLFSYRIPISSVLAHCMARLGDDANSNLSYPYC